MRATNVLLVLAMATGLLACDGSSGTSDRGASTVTTSGTGTGLGTGTGTGGSSGGQLSDQDACKQIMASVCNLTSQCAGATGLAKMGYSSVSACIAGEQAANCATVAQASCGPSQTYHADQAKLCVDGLNTLSCTNLSNGLTPPACDLLCTSSGSTSTLTTSNTGISTGTGTASATNTMTSIVTGTGTATGIDTGQSWTVLVYMEADNNLESDALNDLTEMMQVGSNASLKILAQIDRSADYSNVGVGGLANWTGVKRVRVDHLALTELQNLGDPNMGQAATLASFISWGIQTAPADRYALVLWDHGGAWPQFGVDESHGGDGLTLDEIVQALADGLRSSGLGRPFDIFGFDACLMANYEVLLALSPYARYFIGSEEVEPGHGWDYAALSLARDTPTVKPVELGTAIVNAFFAQAQQKKTDAKVTLSLSDLGQLPTLAAAVSNLAAALGGTNLSSTALAIGRVRADSPVFGANAQGQSSTGMIDLGRFAADLATAQPSLASAGNGVASALGQVVKAVVAGALQRRSLGLSIYFPETSVQYATSYDSLSGVGPWRDFLHQYYLAGAGITSATKPMVVSEVGTVGVSNGEIVLTGQLQPGTWVNVSSTTLFFGVVIGSDDIMLGDTPGQTSATGTMTGSWDASILKISQGSVWTYGYFSISVADAGLAAIDIPLSYKASSASSAQTVFYEIVFDTSSGGATLVSQTFYAVENGAYGELTPVAGSTLQTLLPVVSLDTGDSQWQAQSDIFDATLPLVLGVETLPSGTQIFMGLTAEDYAGNSAWVYGGGTL